MTRVLLIDDNDHVRKSVTMLLDFYEDIEVVGEADNGQTALDLCKELQPDVLILDLMLPDMDGLTVARRAQDYCPDAQIVLLTSSTEYDIIEEAVSLGTVEYVEKTARTDHLVETIYNVSRN